MGKVGYLYESVKDELRWHNMSVKAHKWIVMRIGEVMALDDDQYKKEKTKAMKMSNDAIANALISAFGDGR